MTQYVMQITGTGYNDEEFYPETWEDHKPNAKGALEDFLDEDPGNGTRLLSACASMISMIAVQRIGYIQGLVSRHAKSS